MSSTTTIIWFRRDLRTEDNAALYFALKENKNVLPIFIFDPTILDKLENKLDKRVDYIHQAIYSLQKNFLLAGSTIEVYYLNPLKVFKNLTEKHDIKNVYVNHDYEPHAVTRDKEVEAYLSTKNITFHTFKDQCIFEKDEIIKDDGKPYTVFTPYSRKWKAKLKPYFYKAYPTQKYFNNLFKATATTIPSLEEMGFIKTNIELPEKIIVNEAIIKAYKEQRDYPAISGTTRLSMHLRFGTISVRQLVAKTLPLSETWLNELIWRDFYMMILHHFPHASTKAFKKEYENMPWRNKEEEFKKWCSGETGYPIVDAGMRELNATGFMHNRVRMITSSFLIKHLLIDWRWGEAYFAAKLNDFDLSANNGGWQWAASTGCDAAPYFRIFNPYEQQKKFDPKFDYIKKWVPEFGTPTYCQPIVEHTFARNRALENYKTHLSNYKQLQLF